MARQRIGPFRRSTVDIRFQQLLPEPEPEPEARPTSAGFVPLHRWSPGSKLRPPSRVAEIELRRHVAAQFRRDTSKEGEQLTSISTEHREPDLPERPHSVGLASQSAGRPRSPFSEASRQFVSRPLSADGFEMTPVGCKRASRLGDWPAQSAEEVAAVLTEKLAAEREQLHHAGFQQVDGLSGRWISLSADDMCPESPSMSEPVDRSHPAEAESETGPDSGCQLQAKAGSRGRQSAFFAFVAKQRTLMLKTLPQISAADSAAILAQKWKDLSPEARQGYQRLDAVTQVDLDDSRGLAKREDNVTHTSCDYTKAVGLTDRGRRQPTGVSPIPRQRSPSTEHGVNLHVSRDRQNQMKSGLRAGLDVSASHDSDPAMLQIEEKVMTLKTKGAPLHLGHFSSAPARAHRAQMLHHRQLQKMRFRTAKHKTAVATAVAGLSITHSPKSAQPAKPQQKCIAPNGNSAEGSAELRSPIRDSTMTQSRRGFVYPVQVASPSLFVA